MYGVFCRSLRLGFNAGLVGLAIRGEQTYRHPVCVLVSCLGRVVRLRLWTEFQHSVFVETYTVACTCLHAVAVHAWCVHGAYVCVRTKCKIDVCLYGGGGALLTGRR